MTESFFLIILLIFVGVPFAFYWIPKTLGYPRLGRIFSFGSVILFTLLLLFILFEDELFSKRDAEELLVEQNIKLTDEFELLENKSMIAPGDYYHTFALRISDADKKRVIRSIRSSSDFTIKDTKNWIDDSLFHQGDGYTGKKAVQNYETKPDFIRELFEPKGVGYAPKFRRIRINKKTRTLIFEDIDE